jgi:hypothetical protein
LWYLLTLWTGNIKELDKLQALITKFVWAGQNKTVRHRVRFEKIIFHKKAGALGLISVKTQTRALSAKFVTWSLIEGAPQNDLRDLIQIYIKDLSESRWGIQDFTWVFVKGKAYPGQALNVCQNVVSSWNITKKFLQPSRPANQHDRGKLPPWSPHVGHKDCTKAKCLSNPQRLLCQRGIIKRKDIKDLQGHIKPWDESLEI